MGPRMGIKMGIINGKKIMGYDIGVNGWFYLMNLKMLVYHTSKPPIACYCCESTMF
jgi:hypothetical protein